MYRNIQFSNNNTIILSLGDQYFKNKWSDLFVSDNGKISSFIVDGDISVDYKLNNEDGSYDAILKSSGDFFYRDAEKILDKMYQNKIGNTSLYISGYLDAINKLKADDRIFLPEKNPSFTILFNQEDMIIREINITEDISNNKVVNSLVKKLQQLSLERDDVRSNFHSIKIIKGSISFIFYGFATLNDFVDILVSSIESEMQIRQEIKNNIKRLALSNFIKTELKTLEIISKYPKIHPLHKYQAAVIAIIDLFHNIEKYEISDLSKNQITILKNAIQGIEMFDEVPPIIMRSIVRLRYRFSGDLERLIK